VTLATIDELRVGARVRWHEPWWEPAPDAVYEGVVVRVPSKDEWPSEFRRWVLVESESPPRGNPRVWVALRDLLEVQYDAEPPD
jgi:hypothetical protein